MDQNKKNPGADGTAHRAESLRVVGDKPFNITTSSTCPTAEPLPKRVQTNDDFMVNRQVLICPRCKFEYLHHSSVVTYDRDEDALHTIEAEATNGTVNVSVVPSKSSHNPSLRRHGLAIRFWCEGCESDDLELTVTQHKGNTFIAWRQRPGGGS